MSRYRICWSRWVGGNMNNYESIKQMSIEQMAVMLCVLVAPFAEALNGGKLEEADRRDIAQKMKDFLQAEVKKPNK